MSWWKTWFNLNTFCMICRYLLLFVLFHFLNQLNESANFYFYLFFFFIRSNKLIRLSVFFFLSLLQVSVMITKRIKKPRLSKLMLNCDRLQFRIKKVTMWKYRILKSIDSQNEKEQQRKYKSMAMGKMCLSSFNVITDFNLFE